MEMLNNGVPRRIGSLLNHFMIVDFLELFFEYL